MPLRMLCCPSRQPHPLGFARSVAVSNTRCWFCRVGHALGNGVCTGLRMITAMIEDSVALHGILVIAEVAV